MHRIGLILLAGLGVCLAATVWAQDDRFTDDREAMVRRQIEARDVKDPRVLQAMRRVPRHRFVPTPLIGAAYDDRPLPIGYGQTISQPYIVAFMTEALELTGTEKVLEIGTGSGYQAAVLAETAGEVYSVEIIPELFESAKDRLAQTGYERVRLKADDGYYGWPEAGPFDAVIVTCAAGHIPPPLMEQLKPGGRIIIPVGPPWTVQTLVLAEKSADGQVRTHSLLSVRFVPLVRRE